MNFFFISLGGADDLVILSAIEAANRGHKVSLAVLSGISRKQLEGSTRHGNAIAKSGIDYLPLFKPVELTSIPGRILNHKRIVYQRLRKYIQREKADFCLLNGTEFRDSLPYLKVIQDTKVRYGTLDHGVFNKTWPTDGEIKQLIPIYCKAEANFFVSNRSLALAETQFGVNLASAKVVHNPFLVPFTREFEWLSDNDHLQLACVARLHPTTKGQDILLQILNLPVWRNRKIHINFYGSGGNSESLRREADRLGINSVTFHGFSSDIPSIWKKNHALILPSREENFPLAMVEASLSGRPSLVTDVGGMAEFIKEGMNGFVAPAPTVQFVAEAMERLWENRSSLEEMGRRAQIIAHKEIPESPEKVFVDQLENIVRSK